MFKSFRQWQQRSRAIRELTRLSDQELADLGMVRRDIIRAVNTGSQGKTQADARS